LASVSTCAANSRAVTSSQDPPSAPVPDWRRKLIASPNRSAFANTMSARFSSSATGLAAGALYSRTWTSAFALKCYSPVNIACRTPYDILLTVSILHGGPPALDLVDETFLAVPPKTVAAAFGDPAAWSEYWPDLALEVYTDRGAHGLRSTVRGALVGTMEVWLEPVLVG